MLDNGTFWLSETPGKPGLGWDAACNRVCTWGKFRDKKSDFEFFVFNTHFDHRGTKARKESSILILENILKISENHSVPVVLTGDFNLSPENDALLPVKKELNDAYDVSESGRQGPAGTYSNFDINHPLDRRIDYIFVNDKFSVKKYTVIDDKSDNRYPSDHLPVIAVVSGK